MKENNASVTFSDSIESDETEHWISVSDLMGGLMMVFLLLAVIYMVELKIEKRKIEV